MIYHIRLLLQLLLQFSRQADSCLFAVHFLTSLAPLVYADLFLSIFFRYSRSIFKIKAFFDISSSLAKRMSFVFSSYGILNPLLTLVVTSTSSPYVFIIRCCHLVVNIFFKNIFVLLLCCHVDYTKEVLKCRLIYLNLR